MPTHMLIAYLAILAAIALGAMLTNKARRRLAPEQKLALSEELSNIRMYVIIPALAFLLLMYVKPVLSWIIWGFALCAASFYVLKSVAVKRANAPESYRRACSIERLVGCAGILAFLVAAFWPRYGA